MSRQWTEKEEAYLLKKYLSQPVKKTADILGRTEHSVKRKAANMGLNHYADQMGAKTVANCFRSDVSVVIRWIEKFGLPAKRIVYDHMTRYLIDGEVFWKWAKDHKEIINWSKYERGSLPPEPDWVTECKMNYKTVNSRKPISVTDKMVIRGLLRKDMSYAEIAEQVGRTTESIRHMMQKKADGGKQKTFL